MCDVLQGLPPLALGGGREQSKLVDSLEGLFADLATVSLSREPPQEGDAGRVGGALTALFLLALLRRFLPQI